MLDPAQKPGRISQNVVLCPFCRMRYAIEEGINVAFQALFADLDGGTDWGTRLRLAVLEVPEHQLKKPIWPRGDARLMDQNVPERGRIDDIAAVATDIDARSQGLLAGTVTHTGIVAEKHVPAAVQRRMNSGFRQPICVLHFPGAGAMAIIQVEHVKAGVRPCGNADHLCAPACFREQRANLFLDPGSVQIPAAAIVFGYNGLFRRAARKDRQVLPEQNIQRGFEDAHGAALYPSASGCFSFRAATTESLNRVPASFVAHCRRGTYLILPPSSL